MSICGQFSWELRRTSLLLLVSFWLSQSIVVSYAPAPPSSSSASPSAHWAWIKHICTTAASDGTGGLERLGVYAPRSGATSTILIERIKGGDAPRVCVPLTYSPKIQFPPRTAIRAEEKIGQSDRCGKDSRQQETSCGAQGGKRTFRAGT